MNLSSSSFVFLQPLARPPYDECGYPSGTVAYCTAVLGNLAKNFSMSILAHALNFTLKMNGGNVVVSFQATPQKEWKGGESECACMGQIFGLADIA